MVVSARVIGMMWLLMTGWVGSVGCRAQCATGAIICETFGAGPRGPLPAGQTTFTYDPVACPVDGEYNLMDTVSGNCYGSAWHRVLEDHTPNDVNGNMFVVNAAYKPSEFYSQSVKGLCPGITYEFSLWVLNLNNILVGGACDGYVLRNPIIKMRIEQADGTLINEVTQQPVPRSVTPVWVQLTMQFVIKTNVNDVVLKLINQGLGGCGNDLAIDDIAFRPIHPDLAIQFDGASGSAVTLCADSSLVLRVGNEVGYPNPAYQWQQSTDSLNWVPVPGSGQSAYTINPVLPGRMYYRLLNTQAINADAVGRAQCSATSNVLIVNGRPDYRFSLGPDQTLCEGTSLKLSVPAGMPAAVSFVWSNQSQQQQITIDKGGQYWLNVDLNGCPFRDTIQVVTENCHIEDVYVPDAFTPNADSINDVLVVRHAGDFETYQFNVYDRWGSVIFATLQPDQSWDGTYHNQLCHTGLYAWTLHYSLLDTHHQERSFVRTGRVLLIRE